MSAVDVGTRVHIERDENRYPPRGTWGQFRGKTGTVVEINRDHRRPHLTEYGVVFGKVRKRKDRSGFGHSGVVTWFRLHELTSIGGLAPQRPVEPRSPLAGGHRTRELEAAA